MKNNNHTVSDAGQTKRKYAEIAHDYLAQRGERISEGIYGQMQRDSQNKPMTHLRSSNSKMGGVSRRYCRRER